MGGAAGDSATCPLAAGLCIRGPVCLCWWLSGRTLGTGKLSGVAGVCWGAGLDAVEGGDGLEDTGPASGVAGGCCSGIPGAWVSGPLG